MDAVPDTLKQTALLVGGTTRADQAVHVDMGMEFGPTADEVCRLRRGVEEDLREVTPALPVLPL